MSDMKISEAARALADILEPRPLVGPIIRHQMVAASLQNLIDEAVRQAVAEVRRLPAVAEKEVVLAQCSDTPWDRDPDDDSTYSAAAVRRRIAKARKEVERLRAVNVDWERGYRDQSARFVNLREENDRLAAELERERKEVVRLTRLREVAQGDVRHNFTLLEERDAEVARLRQGLWDCFKAAGGDTDGDETPRALVSDIVPLVLECVQDLRNCYRDEQAKQRPEMGPIPDAVCDKAVMVYEQGDEGSMRSDMRAALEAVRPDLCRYEVVKTRHPLWVDKDGDVWTSELLADAEAMEFWLKLYGPLNPVICVRDPARKEVK